MSHTWKQKLRVSAIFNSAILICLVAQSQAFQNVDKEQYLTFIPYKLTVSKWVTLPAGEYCLNPFHESWNATLGLTPQTPNGARAPFLNPAMVKIQEQIRQSEHLQQELQTWMQQHERRMKDIEQRIDYHTKILQKAVKRQEARNVWRRLMTANFWNTTAGFEVF